MFDQKTDLDALVRRFREGDEEAAWLIVRIYGPHVRRMIRRRMTPALRQACGSSDVQQEVFASLFQRVTRDHGYVLPDNEAAYLAQIVRNTMEDITRREEAQKRDWHSRQFRADFGLESDPRLADSRGDPAAAAEAWEGFYRLLARVPLGYRPAVCMLADGYTQQEVAAMLRVSERHVRRIVSLCRMLFRREG